jgi:tetratricopeptide (TPR) repeat protein
MQRIAPLISENLDKAAEEIEKLTTDTSSAALDFNLGTIRFQQDHLDDALDNYQRAVTKFPNFRRAYKQMGLIYARQGKPDDAIANFTRMIELGGGDAYSYGLLGYSYAAKKDYQASEAAYRNALLLQPQNTEWRLGLTRAVFAQERYQDSITLLDSLIKLYPEKPDFWLLQANSYLNLKQPLRAAENFEAIERMGKSTPDSLYTLGDIYLTENLPDVAAGTYNKAILKDVARLSTRAAPASQPAPAGAGGAGTSDPEWLKSFDRALRASEMLAARGAPASAKTVVELTHMAFDARIVAADRRRLLKLEARLAMAAGGDDAAAAKVLEEIVTIDPLDGEALMLLGQFYGRSNEPEKAIVSYEHAAAIDAFEINAKLKLAQVLVGQRRFADALPLLRRVQEVKPREDVARYMEQVDVQARREALNKPTKPRE